MLCQAVACHPEKDYHSEERVGDGIISKASSCGSSLYDRKPADINKPPTASLFPDHHARSRKRHVFQDLNVD